ncbi:ribonuclease H2 subunit B-like isoform X2 [Primulina tabacum]|uniref:ribonuclease H2 subunit B-like isoform X2 n=1 Tax=Primulina tabacum TaxID=48773 RepID=UPI003F5ACE8A
MAWWEGLNETRVLIAPDIFTKENHMNDLLSLRHPKTGDVTCYLYSDGVLQELHRFKQSYGSWFLGDYVCEDGQLYIATPVDPVFIFLPIFQEARMKKGNDPGKFRQLDEIIYVPGYPGYQSLSSMADMTMQVVCDVKVFDAVSILGEYLVEEPWLKLLCDKLQLNLNDRRNAPAIEIFPTSSESDLASFNPIQVNNGVDKKSTRTTRQTKKTKVEKDSHNIKDMFGRATRKGR